MQAQKSLHTTVGRGSADGLKETIHLASKKMYLLPKALCLVLVRDRRHCSEGYDASTRNKFNRLRFVRSLSLGELVLLW